jgi:excisionase family DNA binding protein
MQRKLLRLSEAAKILDLNYAATARLVRKGILPSVKLGRQVRIDTAQLDWFVDHGGKDCVPAAEDQALSVCASRRQPR